MPTCPSCQHVTAPRHGCDGASRQRFLCKGCHHTFPLDSDTAFAGYHWPSEVILMAVRWDLAHPLSSTSVLVLLAERGGDISPPTVLRWVQTFGPLLAGEIRKYRRRPGTTWYVDEVVFFRDGGKEKRYRYRAVDEHGQVVDILFREQRDTEAANAFFRRVLGRAGTAPTMVVRDHHQPDVPAVQEVFPGTRHVRTGWHRARGETTKPIERSHVPTRDRLRSSRGLKPLQTGQRFFEGFEALQALDRGHIHLGPLIPGDESAAPTPHAHVRAVVRALHTRGAGLRRAA